MFDAAWLEIPDFALRIAASGCILELHILKILIIKRSPFYLPGACWRQSASCILRFHGAFADFRKCM